jgi:hypothetical protein
MNESDGDAMLTARMKALEEIALECFMELCSPLDELTCKQRLEKAIELRAGWSHAQ